MRFLKQKTDQKIILASLSLLFLFGVLLYDDQFLFRSSHKGNQELVGTVFSSSKDVRRKSSDQFFWQPTVIDDNIADEDSIFTGENSSAEIKLFDGSKIELQENSLVQIRMKNNQVKLNLQDGWVKTSLKSGQSLVLDQNGKEMVLTSDSNGEVKIKKSRSGEIDLIVEKGSAKVNNVKAESNKPLVMDNGEIKLQTKVQLYLEQTSKKAVELVQGESPQINFSIYGPAQKTRLKFESLESTAQSFQVTVENNQAQNWPSKISSGLYRVQLVAKSPTGDTVTSNSRDLQIVRLQTPQLVDMQSTYSAIVKPDQQGQLQKSLDIKWTHDPHAQSYVIELNQTDASGHTQNFLSDTNKLNFENLKPGSYSVRLRAQGQTKQTPWSATYSFQFNLESEEMYRPEAPLLTKNDIDFSPVVNAKGEFLDQGPVLRWKPVLNSKPQANKGLEYKVQISSFEDFNFLTENSSSLKDSLEWKRYQKGQYYFRVFAQNAMGLTSPPSEVGKLNIQYRGIELKPIEPIQNVVRSLASVSSAPVQLEWNKTARTSTYQVEVANNAEFKDSKLIQTSTNNTSLNLQPGKYFARVSGYDDHGVDLKITSNIQTIEYDVTLPLEQPTLIEPRSNATIFVQDITKPYVAVRWAPVTGAHYYRVEVATDPKFLQVTKTLESKLNKTVITERLPSGPLYWRVKAFSKLKRQIANVKNAGEFSNWSEQRSFQLGYGDANVFEREK